MQKLFSYQDPISLDVSPGNKNHSTILEDGRIVITSEGNDGSSSGIYAQIFDQAGNPESEAFLVNVYTQFAQQNPAVKSLSDGGFIIAWQSLAQDTEGSSVFAQKFDKYGDKVGAEFRTSINAKPEQTLALIDSYDDGSYVIAWREFGKFFSYTSSQKFSSDGQRIGEENHSGAYTSSSISVLESGGYVIAGTNIGQSRSVSVSVFDENSRLISSEKVNTYTNDDQQFPSVSGLKGGGFVVVWESFLQDGSLHGIYGRFFDDAGKATSEEFLINATTHGDQTDPNVLALPDGGFIVVWSGPEGILGQRFDHSGNRYGGEFIVSNSGQEPYADTLDNGSFVVSWSSGAKIYNSNFAYVDLNEDNLFSYTNQDKHAVLSEVSNGELTLKGNTWKAQEFDYTVTDKSVLEFDYKTIIQGEIQGILLLREGLDPNANQIVHQGLELIRTDGFQAYGGAPALFNNQQGGWQNFKINLNDYFENGTQIKHIVFVNDDDENSNAESAYRDIKLYETLPELEIKETVNLEFIQEDFFSYTNQDSDSQSVLVENDTITLENNTWKATEFTYQITENSYLRVDYQSFTEGEIQGLIFLREELDPNASQTVHEGLELIRFDGFQTYGGNAALYDNSEGGWQTFSVKLSDYYDIGDQIGHLVFVNDDDGNIGAVSGYRNISVFEENSIVGTDQNDILFGTNELDSYFGDIGADLFVVDQSTLGFPDTIQDFKASEGDVIDLSNIISGYNELDAVISDYIQSTGFNNDTHIFVDTNGTGDNFTHVLTLDNTLIADLDLLVNNGNLILA